MARRGCGGGSSDIDRRARTDIPGWLKKLQGCGRRALSSATIMAAAMT